MRAWLRSVPGRIAEALFGAAVVAVAGWLLGVFDAAVPLWVLAGTVLFLAPSAFAIGRVFGRAAPENLELYFAEHIREALETLQKALAGEIPGVTFRGWIERGVLHPARHWLAQRPGEDVRLMIIEPDDAEKEFRLEHEAGHSVEAREKFRLEIAGSFAGFAYASGNTQWSNDVSSDSRWSPHPHARPGREYGSLVSVPIRVGERTVGVLNVLSTYTGAFGPGERAYIELLGSLVNVAYSLVGSDYGEDE